MEKLVILDDNERDDSKEVIEALRKGLSTKLEVINMDNLAFTAYIVGTEGTDNSVIFFCQGLYEGPFRARARRFLSIPHILVGRDAKSFGDEAHLSLCWKSNDLPETVAEKLIQMIDNKRATTDDLASTPPD